MSEVSTVVRLAVDHYAAMRVVFTALTASDPSAADILTHAEKESADAKDTANIVAALKAYRTFEASLKNVDMPAWRISFANYASAQKDEATENLRKAANAIIALSEMHEQLHLTEADVTVLGEAIIPETEEENLSDADAKKAWNKRVREWGVSKGLCKVNGALPDDTKRAYVRVHPTDKNPDRG